MRCECWARPTHGSWRPQVGYLSFLKIGPKLLRFLPGQRATDLRNWLTVYGYWNQGGLGNVTTMLLYLVDNYMRPTGIPPAPIVETPPTGQQDAGLLALDPHHRIACWRMPTPLGRLLRCGHTKGCNNTPL